MQDLQHLLDYIEERIDLDHCAEVDDRYKRALSFEPIDKPPLVISCDEPVSDFTPFPYSEAFYDPAKMMFNQLLERVALGVILRDDSPLAIRSDHGIIQVGSLLGAKWQLTEDNYPWVEHLESREQLELIASGQTPIDLEAGGIVGPSIQTLQFYHQVLAEYPLCRKAIQISMPDLQGPMDTAHLLWGNDIFYAFYDEQELLSAVLDSVVSAMLALEKKYRPLTRDHMDPFGTTQHTYVVPGRLLIRDDTSIMVSSEIYKNFVRTFNANSRIYHHTPVLSGTEPEGWGVLELVSEDRSKAMVGLFRLGGLGESEYTLKFRGLNVSKKYKVSFDNSGDECVIDGFILKNQGVTIRLEAPLTSELLLLENL